MRIRLYSFKVDFSSRQQKKKKKVKSTNERRCLSAITFAVLFAIVVILFFFLFFFYYLIFFGADHNDTHNIHLTITLSVYFVHCSTTSDHTEWLPCEPWHELTVAGGRRRLQIWSLRFQRIAHCACAQTNRTPESVQQTTWKTDRILFGECHSSHLIDVAASC